MAAKFRLCIADSHPIFRLALADLCAETGDLEVVGEAGNGDDLVLLVEKSQPDLIVTDVSLPKTNGLTAVRTLRERGCRSTVLVLTEYAIEESAESAFLAGAQAFALKHASIDELLRIIRSLLDGQFYLAPELPAELLASAKPADAFGQADRESAAESSGPADANANYLRGATRA